MKNIIHMKNSKHSYKSYFENWLQYMYNQNQSSLYIKSKYIYILFSICALFLPKPDRTWENTSPFGISVINTQRRDFTEKKCCFWWIVGKFSAKMIIKRSMEVA